MHSYNELASYYDILMDDVDYEAWTCYIVELFNKYGQSPKLLLEAACGTGNITIPLAERGYEVYGLDISDEMLTIAERKTREKKLDIKYIKQDLANIEINKCFDAILCTCDGINYITEVSDVRSFFKKSYKLLKEDGLLIFDISSYYKLRNILGNNTLFQEKNNIYYIWDNIFNEDDSTVEMNIVFFAPHQGFFKKFEEYHIQMAYSEELLIKLLEDAGFKNIHTYSEFSMEKPKKKSERIFFSAQK